MRLNADGLASRVWSDWGAVCLAAAPATLAASAWQCVEPTARKSKPSQEEGVLDA